MSYLVHTNLPVTMFKTIPNVSLVTNVNIKMGIDATTTRIKSDVICACGKGKGIYAIFLA
jgi:hypothetical protein